MGNQGLQEKGRVPGRRLHGGFRVLQHRGQVGLELALGVPELLDLRKLIVQEDADQPVQLPVPGHIHPHRWISKGESGLFHEYNQLGKPANPTRSRFINQASLHNAIAARVMEGSVLKNNVETVTNNLTRNTNKVMTFNTLASGVQQGFKTLDEMNFEDTRNFLITFVNELSAIRPEVGYLPISERLKIREATIGDSGLIFQAYLRLAGDLQNYPNWPEMLEQLGELFITRDDDGKILYQGDLMSRQNPLWRQTVLVEGKNGRVSIANRTESREYAYRTLRDVVGIDN